MKKKTLLLRFAVLVTAMTCALGANADPYVNYTPSNTTLTFYLDDLRNTRPGTTYDLNTGNNTPGWKNDGTFANVTKVVFDPMFAYARPETTYAWFHGMQNLQSITGIRYLNTSQTTSMRFMFYGCSGLTSVDLSRFNTTNVTSMLSMFYGCSGLTSLNVSNFNTSNVTDTRSMFRNCTGLTSLDLGNFNTANVTSMGNMFNGCTNLTTIYAGSGWTTDAVSQSTDMFSGCTSLVGGQGTTWNASNPTDKTYARIDGGTSNPGYFTAATEAYACYTPSNTTLTFYYDNYRSSRTGTTYDLNTDYYDTGWDTDGTKTSVTKVVFDPSFANARPTTTYDWFYRMNILQSITGMEYLNTSQVTNMGYMFLGCTKLTSLDLSSFNTSNVIDMIYMFAGCTNLQTIYVGNDWSTAAVEESDDMFTNCYNLVGGKGTTYDENHVDKTYAHIDGGPSNPGYFTDGNGPRPYACYTSSNTTLTFYYDSQRSSRTGTTYDLNTGNTDVAWDTDGTNASVTKVVFDSSFAGARPTTTCDWFYNMRNLQSITGMSYLNTSEVTNMNFMFMNCPSLTSLDVSHFNTSKVIYMNQMFNNCTGLTSLDLSSFNTSKVTYMNKMFEGSTNLRTIYVGNGWSTAAVTSSTNMFYNCTRLVGGQGTTYDANHIDKAYAHIDGGPSNPGYFTDKNAPVAYACYTPSNTTLTFYYDNQRSSRTGTTYDLNTLNNSPGWYTDGTNANVTKVVFNSSFAGARPTSTYGWFADMYTLQSITGMEYLNTSEVTNMDYMFCYCNNDNLTSLDLSHFNTSKVTKMGWMFYSCSNLRTIYVGSGWSTAAVTNSNSMFWNCTSLVGGQGTTYNESNPWDKTYAHIDGGPSNPGYFTDKNAPVAYACYTSSNTTLTFYYDNQRSSRTGTTYDLNTGYAHPGWESDGTNASVTKAVFDPSFANARPTTTYDWFYGMENLQSITGMSYLNTSEVTNMAWMFGGCKNLTSLDLTHFNTSKVTDMGAMFYNCSILTSLDVSSFNTSKVTTMSAMFMNCKLTSLDVSHFNTAKVTDMRYMFAGGLNLQTIYVGNDWSTAAVTQSSDMFTNCYNLVGGKGTTYDANHVDKAYAHIDGGPSNPGYFTDKNAALRGDVNGDNNVNITDVTALINYLLSGNATGINLTAANCNQDGSVNISDVTALIAFLLSGQW